MSRKKINYTPEEIKSTYKHIYLGANHMYCTKENLPLTDDTMIDVFDNYKEAYLNPKYDWFNAEELCW